MPLRRLAMHSIWESASFHRRPQLAVVGGGIVGLFSALFYKRRHPGHHVQVLERGPHPSGASVKNAGFACFGSPSELLSDMAHEGLEAALARVEERWRGLQELRAELGDEHIGFEASGGHEIYRKDDALYPRVAEGFDRLNADLRSIFGMDAFHWDDGAIARFGLGGVEHMIRTQLEGPIDTGRMMIALLRKAVESGVAVRPRSAVVAVEDAADGVRLAMLDGTAIEADRVLVCTNGYTGSLLPQLDVVPARGQVLLTAPIPGLALRGTFHLDEGFYYFRDCKGGVLLGGGRNLDIAGETTTAEGVTDGIQHALEDLLHEIILPGRSFTIAQRWSGIMAFGSESKSPIVERASDRIGVAVRLGGMGVAIGIRVARRAVDMMG
ncbi:MAG: FAD-binding oxidoreductase [Flavobacteriales bacterium]|nr:FAD-binding oxidoreductase [Flavobacteriales bacterium]